MQLHFFKYIIKLRRWDIMSYVTLIEKINIELKNKGIKPIYFLIANDFAIDEIKGLINRTETYSNLTESEKNKLLEYLKSLQLQNKLILMN